MRAAEQFKSAVTSASAPGRDGAAVLSGAAQGFAGKRRKSGDRWKDGFPRPGAHTSV
jgi:hypothetical protein